ncbi:MAG: guanylate kinase [Betaproteobacteria bacterium]|nr:guanylate kinase [Betaproteobacteria bacterium]
MKTSSKIHSKNISDGQLFIVSAPSGAGKTTLVRMLLEKLSGMRLSVSHTTRAPRAGEEDGREYHFVDRKRFQEMVGCGDFLEWAEVHGNYYGTTSAAITAELAAGNDVLLEIDWQGAQQVRRRFPSLMGIFIMPPTLEELERRLRQRATDDIETISRRLAAAVAEMRHVDEFDYVIINDDLQTAVSGLCGIVHAARLRLSSQRARHADLFASLFS